MKIIPEVKCRRCGESFSALRSTCPACGTRRVAQSTRTPAPTPSTNVGTPAYERANVNTRWQIIFGLILVVAVILAVIVMVSTGLNDNSYAAPKKTTDKTATVDKTGADTGEETDAEKTPPTPEAIPTPTPSPTPQIQTLEIRYKYDDKKRDDITLKLGEQLPLYAAIMPSDIAGKVQWRIDDDGKDSFKITEDPDNINHIMVECVAKLPAGVGGVYIYASVYGQEVKCMLHVAG